MELKKAVYPHFQPNQRSFEDLDCYKLALQVMVNAHQVAGHLPDYEKYDLASQMRRASKSISANIAEGYGRFHYLEKLRFFSIARGSLEETWNHMITANLLGYIENEFLTAFGELYANALRALNGWMRYVRTQQAGKDTYTPQTIKEEDFLYAVVNEDTAE